jgi:uncharacterized membrane protein
VSSRTAILAAAAGALFLAGHATPSLAAEEAGDGKVKCEGVNSCKGHSDCSTAENKCSGQNSCKGKGFLMLTPEECKAAKDKMAKEG